MFSIGLTGQIASGKSTVASFFKELGIEIISADNIAKHLTEKNTPAFKKIVAHFGSEILDKEGHLNREFVRAKVFNNAEKRIWLEQLLHPLIRSEIEKKVGEVKSPYCIIEIPLLTDKADYPYLKRVLLVEAHPELQVNRCLERDQNTKKEDILTIIAIQNSKKKHPRLIDDIIVNNHSLADLKLKVKDLHELYLDLSTK